MKEKTQDDIKDLIDILIDKEFIKRESGKYPTLTLNKKSQEIFLNKQKVVVKTREVQEIERELNYETELFEFLKEWRRKTAEKESVSPDVIFSDKVLVDLSAYLPLTADDLRKIPGIGEKNFERYGKFFLAAISRYCQSKNISSRMNILERRKAKIRRGGFKSDSDTLSETCALYKNGLSIEEIAERRKMVPSTIATHISNLFAQKRIPSSDLDKFVSPERVEIIKSAFAEIGSFEALSPVKDLLGNDFSYDEIRLARAAMMADEK